MQFQNRALLQMQAFHQKCFCKRIDIYNPNPVLCDFFLFVFVFNTEPFIFMDRSENITTYRFHKFPTLYDHCLFYQLFPLSYQKT